MKNCAKNYTKVLNTLYGDNEDYRHITKKEYENILDNHLESLQKIYDYLEEIGYNTEDLYNLGDTMNLVEAKRW